MRFGFLQSACVMAAGMALAATGARATVVVSLDANSGVVVPNTNNGVTSWSGINTATVGGNTSPTHTSNYASTGVSAIQFSDATDRLSLPSSVISGTGDFQIDSTIYFQTGGGVHAVASTWAYPANTGFEFYTYSSSLFMYVPGSDSGNRYVGPEGVGLSMGVANNSFVDVRSLRVGDTFTIFADLNHNGSFLDAGESLSDVMTNAGNPVSMTSAANMVIGNEASFDSAGAVIHSVQVVVAPLPEPASAATLTILGAVATLSRRRRRTA
jgi:hypothetical protein